MATTNFNFCRQRTLRRRRGLTLVELLLGVVGTALVAMAMTAMLFGFSQGTKSLDELRSVTGKENVVSTRVRAAAQSSRMVLEEGVGYVVLWMADTNGSAVPDLSEVRLVECPSASGNLTSYRAPAGLAPGDDLTFALNDDFQVALAAVKGGATFPASIWATGVSKCSANVNNVNEQLASLIEYQITLKVGGFETTVIGSAALQNRE